MAITKQLSRYAGRRLTRRLMRSVPWLGSAVALLTLGSAMRRKGVLGGALHTVLDFIPYVGGIKNLAEMGRGRDFVPDKRPRGQQSVGPIRHQDPEDVRRHQIELTSKANNTL